MIPKRSHHIINRNRRRRHQQKQDAKHRHHDRENRKPIRRPLKPRTTPQPLRREPNLHGRQHNSHVRKHHDQPAEIAPHEETVPAGALMVAAQERPPVRPWRREAVDPIQAREAQLAVLVARADTFRRRRRPRRRAAGVDVVQDVGHEGRPALPVYVCGKEAEFAREAEVAGVADEPGVGEEEAAGGGVQVWRAAEVLRPCAWAEEEGRERLHEDAVLVPDQVQVGLLRHHDAAVQQLLAVQGAGTRREAREPEVLVDHVEAGDVEFKAEVLADVMSRLEELVVPGVDEGGEVCVQVGDVGEGLGGVGEGTVRVAEWGPKLVTFLLPTIW